MRFFVRKLFVSWFEFHWFYSGRSTWHAIVGSGNGFRQSDKPFPEPSTMQFNGITRPQWTNTLIGGKSRQTGFSWTLLVSGVFILTLGMTPVPYSGAYQSIALSGSLLSSWELISAVPPLFSGCLWSLLSSSELISAVPPLFSRSL